MEASPGMAEQPHADDSRLTRRLGKFWTVANGLSLSRAVLVLPITYLILIDGPIAWILGLVLVAGLTDWFDGRVARWTGTVSGWGKVLDPLSDKFAAAAVTVALVVRGLLPLWFLLFILLRDALIVVGGVILTRRTGMVAMSVWWGKVAVTMLGVTVMAAVLRADAPIIQVCIWLTTGLMVYAFGLYVARFIRLWRGLDAPDLGSAVAPLRPDA